MELLHVVIVLALYTLFDWWIRRELNHKYGE
jgi:hypothetical protein